MLVLIASIILVYHTFATSRQFFSVDAEKVPKPVWKVSTKKIIPELTLRIKTLEDATSYYQGLFTDFEEQLKYLGYKSGNRLNNRADTCLNELDYQEDWKELYFEENEKKVALENELDVTSQRLEAVEKELRDERHNGACLLALQLELEASRSKIESQRQEIADLQDQLKCRS